MGAYDEKVLVSFRFDANVSTKHLWKRVERWHESR